MNNILTGSALLTSLLLIGCGGGGSTRDKSLDTTLSGSIYEDLNNNNKKDSEETGIGQIKVTITGAKGKEHIVLTDINGKYHLSKIVPGKANIEIDTTTLPKDADIKGEVITTEHLVIVDKANQVDDVAYTLPELDGKAEVHGKIFKDFDQSYDFSDGDEGLKGISVTMTDANGMTSSATTDDKGNYVFSDVPVGTTTITVDESTVPDMESISERSGRSTQDFKIKDVTVEVKKGIRNKADSIGYFSTSQTLGLVTGTVFFDTNKNGKYDDSDERLEGITVTLKDSAGVTHTVKTRDATGHVAFKGQYFASVPPGEVTSIVVRNTFDRAYKNIIGKEVDTDNAVVGEITYLGGFGFTNK